MSYEYVISGPPDVAVEVLYAALDKALTDMPGYVCSFREAAAACYRAEQRTSPDGWGCDIELYHQCGRVFMTIYSGIPDEIDRYLHAMLRVERLSFTMDEQ